MKGDIFCLLVLEMFLSVSKCVNMKYVFCLPQHVFTFEECLFESVFFVLFLLTLTQTSNVGLILAH